ncbi:YdeI/OmpD-associated family protein [Actinoplanes sp. NPDC020271]|uniref:YdeI/OmpD-associated family protein n=1 Tax=Actinoplanes sp. NPDC020271 TaxID=3363896 RepID=UPI0037B0C379
MAETLNLTLTLESRGPAGAFLLSDEQVAAVGDGKKAFPVQVTVNDVTLPLRLARMGGENMIGLAKAARAKADIEIGSAYAVTIAPVAGERTVETPPELQTALAGDEEARSAYGALAYSHRKEFVRWITEAKRETTRADRVAKTLEMLRAGEHR